MRIHHLNCGTMCVRGRFLVNDSGGLFAKAHLVCHCLLIESDAGLILVDTGIGMQDILKPEKRIGRLNLKMLLPALKPEESALKQVATLGFKASDVRHIIVTHLDLDHIGGIADFPQAQIHIFKTEYETGVVSPGLMQLLRYRRIQWNHHPVWDPRSLHGEQWFGLESVQALEDKLPEILIVPLAGHTPGHSGIAVKTDNGWLFHCGDAYFYHAEVSVTHPHCTPVLTILQQFNVMDRDTRRANVERLRQLKQEHPGEVDLFCSHDPSDFERLQHKNSQ
ncbi:MAG: MBL fold metallo-hydrolase [SAR324 cluster bacterium]|nr:MBL fold metallo-hydrolase [SAR324 cluster bacterium]